jgi:aromatic ring hydroxylase
LTEVSFFITWSSCRDEIAGCSEKAYDYLSINDAKKMLMFSSDQELSQYISEVFLFLFRKVTENDLSLYCFYTTPYIIRSDVGFVSNSGLYDIQRPPNM